MLATTDSVAMIPISRKLIPRTHTETTSPSAVQETKPYSSLGILMPAEATTLWPEAFFYSAFSCLIVLVVCGLLAWRLDSGKCSDIPVGKEKKVIQDALSIN